MTWGPASPVWLWLGIGLLAAGGGAAILLALTGRFSRGPGQPVRAGTELDIRFARGDIGQDEYAHRRAVLDATFPARPGRRWHWNTGLVAGLAVVMAVGAASVALAATMSPSRAGSAAGPRCTVPALPGHLVDVRLWDMRGMMGGRYPGGGYYPGGMMGGGYGPGGGAATPGRWAGMMRVTANPSTVGHGTVSFRVGNSGSLAHELVILPLPAAGAGTRAIGADGTVSESGSLGEASASCAAGAGQGIRPGTAGWVTLHLAPGRYELICNLPGHYARGMYTELDVR